MEMSCWGNSAILRLDKTTKLPEIAAIAELSWT